MDSKITKRKFYIWWLSVLLIATAVFWAHEMGIILKIWNTDVTMITSLIGLGFIGANVMLGYASYQSDGPLGNKRRMLRAFDTVWFVSEQLMALGMLGTVIGLIHMLATNMSGMGIQGSDAVQSMLGGMWESMGLALYTNAVGLVTSIILKIQVHFLSGGAGDEK